MILEIDIGAGFVPVSCLTDVGENESVQLIGTTTRQNGSWKTSRPITQNKTISITGLLPVDAALFSWEDLATLKRNRTEFAWRIDTDTGFGFISDLSLDGTVGDDVTFSATIQNSGKPIAGPPSGYTVEWLQSSINASNENAAGFRIFNAEIGASYNYSITSNNGGTPVTGSGTVAAETQFVTPINVSGLNDGVVTVSVTLSNTAGSGPAVTDAIAKVIVQPPQISIGPPVPTEVVAGQNVEFAITYTGATSVTLGVADITQNKTGNVQAQTFVLNTGTFTRTVRLVINSGTGTIGISIDAGTASNSGGSAPAAGPSAVATVAVPDSIQTLNPLAYFNPDSIDPSAVNSGDGVSVWNDLSGNGFDATPQGASVVELETSGGRQIKLRNGNSYLEFGPNAALDLIPKTDEFTVVARVRNPAGVVNGYLVAQAGATQSQRMFGPHYQTGVDKLYNCYVGGVYRALNYQSTGDELYIFVVSLTEWRFYVDGALLQTWDDSNFGTGNVPGIPWAIGARDGGNFIVDADGFTMDLVALIPSAITEPQRAAIEAQWRLNTPPPPSGYALAWDSDPIGSTTPGLTLTAGNGEGTGITGVITSSGGGSPVNVNETFASTPYNFTVNVASLPNGTLSANLTVTGPNGTQTITPVPTTTKNL